MRGIMTADWHLKHQRPRCRLDENWLETQRGAVAFILTQANERECDIFIVGDLLDASKVPPEVTNMLIEESKKLKKGLFIYVLVGNHDSPYHSMELIKQASIYPFISGELEKFRDITKYFPGAAHFNGERQAGNGVIFLHHLIFKTEKEIPPDTEALSARQVIDIFPNAELIITGDNHNGFLYSEKKGIKLINCGSLLRITSDLIDYQPVCYYVDTHEEIVEAINIPDPGELVTDAYVQKAHEREDRIQAFVEKIQSKEQVSLSFIDNVRETLNKKGISTKVKDAVKAICENGGIEL